MSLKELKCPNCGGRQLNLNKGIITCQHCKTVFTESNNNDTNTNKDEVKIQRIRLIPRTCG